MEHRVTNEHLKLHKHQPFPQFSSSAPSEHSLTPLHTNTSMIQLPSEHWYMLAGHSTQNYRPLYNIGNYTICYITPQPLPKNSNTQPSTQQLPHTAIVTKQPVTWPHSLLQILVITQEFTYSQLHLQKSPHTNSRHSKIHQTDSSLATYSLIHDTSHHKESHTQPAIYSTSHYRETVTQL